MDLKRQANYPEMSCLGICAEIFSDRADDNKILGR